MKTIELWMLEYLLNSLWEIPLVFAAAWLTTRVVRRSSSSIEHRIWVAALAFAAVLPACSFHPAELFLSFWRLVRLWGTGSVGGEVQVTVLPGAALQHSALRLPVELLAIAAVAYGCSIAWFAVRLAFGLWRTAAMRRRADCIVLSGDAGRSWERCSLFFDVHDAEAAVSHDIEGPVTIGIRRKTLLLPAEWQTSLSGGDLDAAIAHEFSHMRRGDFAKNLVYELLSLPIAYHPLLWLIRAKLAESREMVCDAMAAEAVAGREKYARSLLRLASRLSKRTPARTLHAIGIFDANIFERRIMSLTENRVEFSGARRSATTVLCVLLGFGTCASALALRINVSVPAVQSESQPARPSEPARISSNVMAGNLLTHVTPIYPPDARAARVSGSVVLHAIIGRDGEIKTLEAISGPEMLQASALYAVKQWRYTPYLLNGNPTEVDTTIIVNYTLNP